MAYEMSICLQKGNGKSRPTIGQEVPEAEVWSYSFYNLCASWGWVFNATLRPLYPYERDPVTILQEVGWIYICKTQYNL